MGGGRVVGAVEQRAVAVLVAVEHRQQRVGVVGVVGVHGRVGRGADRHRGVGGEAHEDHRHAEQHRVERRPPGAVCPPRGPAHAADERQREERDARVDGQPQRVDEREVDHRPDVDRVGDDDVVDEDQDGPGGERGDGRAAPRDAVVLAEVVDEDQRGDGQQVEDMHADREPHQVGDQDDPACGPGPVGLLLPLEHEPYHQRREHRREGVDLALDGREPEGVGEGVGQRSHGACAQRGDGPRQGELAAAARDETARQVGDRPEEEEDAEGARQRVHGVDGDAHVVGRGGEEGGQARQHHEERGAGWVAHLELVGGGDELGAVPEARDGLHGQKVDRRRYGEDGPADDVVPAFEECHRIVSAFLLSFGGSQPAERLSARRVRPSARGRLRAAGSRQASNRIAGT